MLRAAALAATLLATSPASAADWRALDPENTLVIDTSKGRIIVEMRPELAPKAVERIKLLTRERVYDGLQFHRVVPGFVAQTGNPNNKDGGVSRHPDLEPEFTFKLDIDMPMRDGLFLDVSVGSDGINGLFGTTPVTGEMPLGMHIPPILRGWGAYCTGVAGMGRQAAPGTANSEIFFMLEPERRLDHDYTVWGRIVVGQDVLASLAVGEPPAKPDAMTRVRVASALPASERPRVEIEDGDKLRARIDAARTQKGADFSVCDVMPAVRVMP